MTVMQALISIPQKVYLRCDSAVEAWTKEAESVDMDQLTRQFLGSQSVKEVIEDFVTMDTRQLQARLESMKEANAAKQHAAVTFCIKLVEDIIDIRPVFMLFDTDSSEEDGDLYM